MTRPTERQGGMPAVQHLSDDELLRLLLPFSPLQL